MTGKALLAAMVLFCTACQKHDMAQPAEAPVVSLNVSYGTDARQKMDIYLPGIRSADTTRSIVLIHGGAWVDGDKNDFNEYVSVLQQRFPSYAIFNLNYRLYNFPNNPFPAQEDDIRSAVDYIYGHRSEYRISADFVYLGASAGAQLVLLQAYKNTETVRPTAVVSFFAPTELRSLYSSNPLASILLGQLTGSTPSGNPAAYDEQSPVNFVDTQVPPTIILHGGADTVVPVSQALLLTHKLDSVHATYQYITYPQEGHGWVGNNLEDSFDKITTFLNQHR